MHLLIDQRREMTPEDRAIYKWIVTWAQGKLSGEKASSGAAVPAKLPTELQHVLKTTTPDKTKTKRRGQGHRAKTARRAAAPGSSREEDKATGPAPPAPEADPAPAASTPEGIPAPAAAPREEDPAPAASTREDAWTTVGPRRRRPKRKRGESISSPTKGKHSKRPSAPSQPPPPPPPPPPYRLYARNVQGTTIAKSALMHASRVHRQCTIAALARWPDTAYDRGSAPPSLPASPGRPDPQGRQHSQCPPWTRPPSVHQRHRRGTPSPTLPWTPMRSWRTWTHRSLRPQPMSALLTLPRSVISLSLRDISNSAPSTLPSSSTSSTCKRPTLYPWVSPPPTPLTRLSWATPARSPPPPRRPWTTLTSACPESLPPAPWQASARTSGSPCAASRQLVCIISSRPAHSTRPWWCPPPSAASRDPRTAWCTRPPSAASCPATSAHSDLPSPASQPAVLSSHPPAASWHPPEPATMTVSCLLCTCHWPRSVFGCFIY